MDRAKDKWKEAQSASSREEALKIFEDMRLILEVGDLHLQDIDIDEEKINDLLRSKA